MKNKTMRIINVKSMKKNDWFNDILINDVNMKYGWLRQIINIRYL
jgi:hypothetical protein